MIDKILLNFNNPFEIFQKVKSSKPLKVSKYQAMIFFDFTDYNKYILCTYFNEFQIITISSFNSELDLLNSY